MHADFSCQNVISSCLKPKGRIYPDAPRNNGFIAGTAVTAKRSAKTRWTVGIRFRPRSVLRTHVISLWIPLLCLLPYPSVYA